MLTQYAILLLYSVFKIVFSKLIILLLYGYDIKNVINEKK